MWSPGKESLSPNLAVRGGLRTFRFRHDLQFMDSRGSLLCRLVGRRSMLTCCRGMATGTPALAGGSGSEDEFIASHGNTGRRAPPRISVVAMMAMVLGVRRPNSIAQRLVWAWPRGIEAQGSPSYYHQLRRVESCGGEGASSHDRRRSRVLEAAVDPSGAMGKVNAKGDFKVGAAPAQLGGLEGYGVGRRGVS